jgi:hypothetical protein
MVPNATVPSGGTIIRILGGGHVYRRQDDETIFNGPLGLAGRDAVTTVSVVCDHDEVPIPGAVFQCETARIAVGIIGGSEDLENSHWVTPCGMGEG